MICGTFRLPGSRRPRIREPMTKSCSPARMGRAPAASAPGSRCRRHREDDESQSRPRLRRRPAGSAITALRLDDDSGSGRWARSAVRSCCRCRRPALRRRGRLETARTTSPMHPPSLERRDDHRDAQAVGMAVLGSEVERRSSDTARGSTASRSWRMLGAPVGYQCPTKLLVALRRSRSRGGFAASRRPAWKLS